ncbi:DMT family transporter [Thalassotalea piscium]
MGKIKVVSFTFVALVTFAANSVICRLALGGGSIDAASYTMIRLLAGVIALLILVKLGKKGKPHAKKGSWLGGITLFLYACTLSYAYISLDTATGALILFGAVQLSILLFSYFRGDKFHLLEWLGIIIAFVGFVYLVFPLMSQPSMIGAVLMVVSGASWGMYTLVGQGSKRPLIDTCYNFVRTIPFVLILCLLTYDQLEFTNQGVLLAILSGAITSGVGYAIWYLVLPSLATTQAAVLQLTVPIIAALGGVIFVSEPITLRLFISSVFVLGGIALVIFAKTGFLAKRES